MATSSDCDDLGFPGLFDETATNDCDDLGFSGLFDETATNDCDDLGFPGLFDDPINDEVSGTIQKSIPECNDKPKISQALFVKIIKSSLDGINWNRCTDDELICRICKNAAEYGFTFEDLQENSILLAKEYSEFEYIPMDYDEYRFTKDNMPEVMHQYSKLSFVIYVDNNNRIWVISRNGKTNHKYRGYYSNSALKLISCLGPVYVLIYSRSLSIEFIDLPDNIIYLGKMSLQLSTIMGMKITFSNLPKYLKGYDLPTCPLILCHGPLQFLKLYTLENTENIPCGTTEIVMQSFFNSITRMAPYVNSDMTAYNFDYKFNFYQFPVGMTKISISDVVFSNSFNVFPPTTEIISIDNLNAELKDFPSSTKILLFKTVYTMFQFECRNSGYYYHRNLSPNSTVYSQYMCICCNLPIKRYILSQHNIKFNEGFEELHISKSYINYVLPNIRELPKSFKKLTIYMIDSSTCIPYNNASILGTELGEQLFQERNNAEFLIFQKDLDDFSLRFPHVEIIKANVNIGKVVGRNSLSLARMLK
jgi:hypothetical protein